MCPKRLLFVFYCVAVSCSAPDYLSEKDLVQYVFENDNLSKSIATDNTKVTAVFRPADLLMAQEIRAVKVLSDSVIREAQAKYRDHYYFIVSISRRDNEILAPDAAHFADLLQTLSFRMSNFVNLTTSNQDTIPVADYVYDRTFGLSSSTDLLFAFDKSKASKEEWIQINLDEFGLGIGKQSIRFNVDDLENTPRIYHK